MTAILGRVALDGRPLDAEGFRHAFEALRPAGTVRSGFQVAGAVGLGHHDRGLEMVAPQPVTQGRLTLVADARIYNRGDLARALDCRLDTTPDADLILRAYGRWGPECLQRINGDFGIAIHDAGTGELFLARDHIGARPLFWTRRGNEVLFATLLHGLTAFDDLDWPLNTRRIARYLCSPMDHRLESFLDGVEAVGPGQWLRISAGQVTRQRWWDPDAIAPRTGIDPAAAQQEMRALTEAAIRARLPRCARVGAHFSGGVDSTLVTIMASRALQEAGSNLTAAYAWCPPVDARHPDMGPGDERRIIAARCAELGVPARYGAATPATLEALVAQPMELQGTADLMDELPIIAQAQGDGLGVMLSGWGGDEAFSSSGPGHNAWLLRQGRMAEVLRLVRRHGGGLRRPDRMAQYLWRTGIVPLLPGPIQRHVGPFYNLFAGGAFPSAEMRALDAEAEPQQRIRLLPDANAYMRQILKAGHLAERMATWTAWAAPAGFEYRYPLVDRQLMEFVLSLPPDIRFAQGSGRYPVLRAFRDLLPAGVGKTDCANERLRLENRRGWWRMLATDARRGRFDAPCPWLDMPALKAAVSREPPAGRYPLVATFARLHVALRIHALYGRAHGPRAPEDPAHAPPPQAVVRKPD